ncbi:MAG: hypothetical protein AAFR81_05570 [Chloroflexota bacterium]
MVKSIQENVVWRAIPIAGIVAGTAMLITLAILNPLLDGISSFFNIRYFASLIMGTDVLLEPTTMSLIVGLLVHYGLSILFTFIIGIVVHRWGIGVGIFGGGILGLAFYSINFFTMTVIFDWMVQIAGSSSLIMSHLVFGIVAGGVYELLDDYDQPFITPETTKETA